MYPVSEAFNAHMKADLRRVEARVTIDYTDHKIDQSLTVTASEQANVSYPQQTADGVTQVTHKWASLDGSWVLDGTYHLAPRPDDLVRYQMGWWGRQLAGADGSFAPPYPSLTVTHIPRPVHTLRVVGDSARREWPVDFRIDLYGPDDTLLRSEVVTGNTVVEWSMTLPAPVLDVAKQVLTLTRWSHPGRQAKILEFFTSIQETYLSEDIIEIRLLEEREASQGSLPVGNISANEISIKLANVGSKFDVTNQQSPLWGLLKPNRRIRAWLGLRGAGDLWGDGWYAPFDRDLAVARRDGAVQEPLPGYVATLRPGEGRFGGAVAVEEGTVNLYADGDYESGQLHPVKASGWEIVNDDSPKPQGNLGSKVLKCSRTDGVSTWHGRDIPISPNTTYTASVWVWLSPDFEGSWVRLAIERAGGTLEGFTSADLNIRGKWQRLVRTGVSGPEATNARVLAYVGGPTNGYVLYDGMQFEQKPFATSFVDGTRAAGRLMYPPELINVQEGTFSAWVYVGDGLLQSHAYIFALFDDTSTLLLLQRTASGTLQANVGGRIINSIAFSSLPQGWHHFALTWTPSQAVIYVDGEPLTVRSLSEPLPVPVSPLFTIGAHPRNNNRSLNSMIDELLILPYAASEEHIARLYAKTRPLYEEWVYDEWVPLGTFWSLDWDSPDDTLEATVVARDRLELLRKSTYQPGQVQQNVSLYTLAEQVLQDAGLEPGKYAIDPALQSIIVPWAWLSPTSHREALRIIAEAALAVVYADRDGVVRIETLGSVPSEPVLEITDNDYFPPLQAPSRQDQVANEIVVTTQPLKPADTPEEVYRSTTPISVPAGQTVTVKAKYNQPPVIESTASLDNPPAGVSITSVTYYAWGAEVTIQNTSGSNADVTLVITGKPLSVQGGEQVIVRDEASIIENGVLRYEFPVNPLVQTLAQAQAIANALLASAKDPRRDIEVEWMGNPALELGDRVTVVGQDVYVIRQEIDWAGALSARLTGRRAT